MSSGLYENELTKTLLETMDEFCHTDLLSRFLEKAKIKHTKGQLGSTTYNNFSTFKASEQDKRTLREVDGIIETEKQLIFIEAKKGNNKHEVQQLVGEYQIGTAQAKKLKKDFYLIAIDENITEPDIIEKVRKSSYAGIKKQEVCWISWHEITKILKSIYENFEFEGVTTKNIFFKRLEKYNQQDFKAFDRFDRAYINQVSIVGEFIVALRNYNSEILNFIKGVESELISHEIVRLYKTSIRKVPGKGRKKYTHKSRRLMFEQNSIGISMHKNSIAKAYVFPYSDADWTYDLSRNELDHYLYLRFSFIDRKLFVGYRLQKNKFIKQLIKEDFAHQISKFKSLSRKSLQIEITDKHSTRVIKAHDLNQHIAKEMQAAANLLLYFEFDVFDEDLLNKSKAALIHLRDFVNSYDFVPPVEDISKVEKISTEEIEEEEVSVDGEEQ